MVRSSEGSYASLSELFVACCHVPNAKGEPIAYWHDLPKLVKALPHEVSTALGIRTSVRGESLTRERFERLCSEYCSIVGTARPIIAAVRINADKRRESQAISQHQFVALLWQRLAAEVDTAIASQALVHRRRLRVDAATALDTHRWATLAHIVVSGLPDAAEDMMAEIGADEVCLLVEEGVARRLGVSIDTDLMHAHVVGVILNVVAPSRFFAETVLRCEVMTEMLGEKLSQDLRHILHCELTGDVDDAPPSDNAQVVLDELVQTRQELARLRAAVTHSQDLGQRLSAEILGRSLATRHVLKKPFSLKYRGGTDDELKSVTVQFALDCRAAFRHVPSTLVEAESIIHRIKTGDPIMSECVLTVDRLCSRWTLGRHALLMDSALDLELRNRVEEAI